MLAFARCTSLQVGDVNQPRDALRTTNPCNPQGSIDASRLDGKVECLAILSNQVDDDIGISDALGNRLFVLQIESLFKLHG